MRLVTLLKGTCAAGVLIAGGLASAGDFVVDMTATGAVNLAAEQFGFGLKTGAQVGYNQADGDVFLPPPTPSNNNVYFANSLSLPGTSMSRDIRPPANAVTWTLVVQLSATTGNPQRDVVTVNLGWTIPQGGLGVNTTLKLQEVTDAGAPIGAEIDMTSTNALTVENTAQVPKISYYQIRYAVGGERRIVVSKSSVTTTEAGGTAQFTIKWEGTAPTADIHVPVVSQDPTEGTVSPAEIVLNAGKSVDTVTVAGVNDQVDDGDQGYTISVGPTVSTDTGYNGISPGDVLGTNIDDDTAGLTATPPTITTTESGGRMTVSVTLGTQPADTVHVDASIASAEATVAPGSIQFAPADWPAAKTKTFVVTGADDTVIDGNVAYNLVLSMANSLDVKYKRLADITIPGHNLDNDAPGLVVRPLVGLVTKEDGTTATFTAQLRSQPAQDVTATFTSSAPTEGTVDPAQHVFTAANWNNPVTVTLTGQPDGVVDGDVPYQVAVALASADANYAGKTAVVQAVNQNTDQPAAQTNVVFLPDATLPFGDVFVGTERVLQVTLVNRGQAATTVTAQAKGDAGFSIRNAGADTRDPVPVALPAGTSKSVRVKYTAGATPGAQRGTLEFTENSQVVKAISLTATTVPALDGGVLRIKPAVSWANRGGTNPNPYPISFDLELNTDTAIPAEAAKPTYIFFQFSLDLPVVISPQSLTVTTNTARTSNVQFATETTGQVVTFTYADLSGVGIPPGDGKILTVGCTVDTTREDFFDLHLFDVSTTAITAEHTVTTVDGQLAVTSVPPTADLDVNGNGIRDFRDVVLIYRYIRLGKTAEAGNLVIPGYDPLAVGAQKIQESIQVLRDAGLDVNGNGTPDFRDVVLIYRYVRLGKTAAAGNLVIPGYDPLAIGAQKIEDNIKLLLP